MLYDVCCTYGHSTLFHAYIYLMLTDNYKDKNFLDFAMPFYYDYRSVTVAN